MSFGDPCKFSNEEIREKLTIQGCSIQLIDSIIETFWFHDWGNSFITFPMHFQLLQNYLAETKPKTFSRFDFYKYFYQHIVQDYEKLKVSLQKLALVFELMQTDRMPPAEFFTVLKEIKAPAGISKQNLQNLQLISPIEVEGKQLIKWTHHTLTEYLAAEYILSQKDPFSVSEKFMIYTDGTTSFKPSWNGALSFLLEQSPESFVDGMINFIKKNSHSLDDNLAETLIFATPATIKPLQKTALFDLVFYSYQEKKFWIPVWVRYQLYKFIDEKNYQAIKTDKNDNYVIKGNIAAIIDGMLQHDALSQEEKTFWRNRLITYANEKNDNGVLQRHSLAALGNFKGDIEIIKKVAKNNVESADSLVREAFIRMCEKIDPNSPDSIAFFTKAIADDRAHIYARNALYSITTKKGIKTLLKAFANMPSLVHELLDKESIFNNKEKKADRELIENIQKVVDHEVRVLIKKIIIAAFTGEGNYHAGDSYFLQQLALIVQSAEQNYLYELVKVIQDLTKEQKQTLFINDIEGIIAVLLTPKDIEPLRGIFTKDLHTHAGYALAEAVRLAIKVGNPHGAAILKRGIEIGITADPKASSPYGNLQEKRDRETYEQFQKYLSPPTKGQYFPQVFRYYVECQKTVGSQWTDAEKKRLLDLAVDSNLNKIEPEKIKVHYKDRNNKSGEYTISSIAGYFASVLQVIHILRPNILQKKDNRQKVINFIPFAYSNDAQILKDILGNISDEELTTLNKIMLDKNNDARYLVPQTYIYLMREFNNLKSPKEVLVLFVVDPFISDSDQRYALKSLKKYLSSESDEDKAFLKNIEGAPDLSDEAEQLAEIANGHLIAVFKDEDSIKWRFQEIKERAIPMEKREKGSISWGTSVIDIDSLTFANPLFELKDERYMDLVIDLLDFSLTIIAKPDYWEYVNYIWRIAIAYVIRDDFFLSQSALQKLKTWAIKHSDIRNINWFNKKLEMAISSSTNMLTNINSVSDSLELIKK